MGNLFSGGTETAKQPYEKNPWEPQQPYLTSGFTDARSALNDAQRANRSIDDPVADLTGAQYEALSRMHGAGRTNQNITGEFVDRLSHVGLQGMEDYAANAGDIYGEMSQDRTGTILENAGKYANSPYMDDQIDAALSDVRTAFDREKAGINATASGSGNINSTRAGVLESRALDDSMDRAAQVSSNMRGAAYENGLNMAAQQEDRRLSGMFDANRGIGSAAGASFGTMMDSMRGESEALDSIFRAGGVHQDQQQAEIDGSVAQGNRGLDLVAKYMGTVGGNYGGEGYQTSVRETQSPFQTILGGAATMGGLGWSPFG